MFSKSNKNVLKNIKNVLKNKNGKNSTPNALLKYIIVI
jgi:hypothetical protein